VGLEAASRPGDAAPATTVADMDDMPPLPAFPPLAALDACTRVLTRSSSLSKRPSSIPASTSIAWR
jgi:hypothetical protein